MCRKVEQVLAETGAVAKLVPMDSVVPDSTAALDRLTALEEIRRVKHRYLRCVDLKRWDDLADTFTPDATADYGTPALGKPIRLAGRDSIVAFLRERLGPDIITVHFASQPEMTSTATRPWARGAFEDTVIATEYRMMITGAAFYEDRYARATDGRWRIAHTGYVRTYEATWPG